MAPVGALTLSGWVEARTAGAPAALRNRILEHVRLLPADLPAAEALALAARRSLDGVLAAAGNRGVALDLLAADGLITLALLRQGEDDPAALAAFARSLTEAAASA
ncbi:MAG TPA: hypothetical protein VF037_11010 [Gemmatimonadales bacterium]